MAVISRAIPTLLRGISQAADATKQADHADIQDNADSNPVLGLVKRSGLQYITNLSSSTLGNVDIQTGEIVLKNGGSVSNIKFYCESSNAHYTQLQSAAHSAYSGNVTLTLPASTDTLVGRATTDTLTNKTLTAPTITGDLVVDTNTLKVDSSNNRVGILNASPDVSLDIGSATDYNANMVTSNWVNYNDESDASRALTYQASNTQSNGTSFQHLGISTGNDNDQSMSGELYVFAPSSSTFNKHFFSRTSTYTANNHCYDTYSSGYFNTATRITRFNFK